jgi:predicted nucleic acid-binding protein
VAVVARYLIDTSAAARIHHEGVAERLAPLITAGLVATCAPLDFEALFSARGAQDYEQIRTDRWAAYEYLPVLDEHWQRAMDVQRSLAGLSRHRGSDRPVGRGRRRTAPHHRSALRRGLRHDQQIH